MTLHEHLSGMPHKRKRATKTQMQERRAALIEIVAAMRPMTVRQVFYQATVKGIVEKTEAGYDKIQTTLAEESERRIISAFVGGRP
jgi:hypothetical protein